MLVLAREGDRARGEDSLRLAELLRSWTGGQHLPGLAVFPVRLRDRPVDAVVLTPAGLVVVRIAGFREQQRGVLDAPAVGPWRVGEEPAALHGHAEDANPMRWLESDVLAVRNALRAMGVDTGFVSGLVAVVPSFPGDVRLRGQGRMRRGSAVVLGEAQPLWRYFHRLVRGRSYWSADDALAACAALGVYRELPSRAELVRERFPEAARRVSTVDGAMPPVAEHADADDYLPPVRPVRGRAPIPRNVLRGVGVALAVTAVAVLLAVMVHGLFHG